MSSTSRVETKYSTATRTSQSALWGRVFKRVLKYLILGIIALFMLLPLIWMISSSLKLRPQIFVYPPVIIPNPVDWQNYIEAWMAYPFGLYAFNSLKVATLGVIGQIIVCSMGGYGFARFDFPLKNVLFGMLLAVMMVPGIVNLIPQFILFHRIGLLDTHWTLILPMALANTFGTFLFRQFMITIPKDLEDAARIDGASAFAIYWRIMLPLAKPAIAVLATFTFIASWNQLTEPVIFLQSQEKFTMTVGLAFFRTEIGTAWDLLMAGSIIALLPAFVIFLFTQKYFVQGITMTGLKY